MFEIVSKVMSPDEIKDKNPLSLAMAKQKKERDNDIKNIIAGVDSRRLLIAGPCSADNEDAVCDYVCRLAKAQEQVKDKIMIVPRIYTNKPRTRGEGYKGMLHSPDPHKGTDIQGGIMAIRHMHMRIIAESGLSGADEMLYPDNFAYLDDVLSYVSIGARSSENQQHRLVASGFEVAAGIKNPMNGSFSVMLNSIYAAQISNEFKYNDNQVRTTGNPYAHAVLRGSVDLFGNNIANYHYEDVMKCAALYKKEGLTNPAIVIDMNHSNSNKNPLEQVRIMNEILSNVKYNNEFGEIVKGFMLESYIEDGNQQPNENVYGKSITDACLGWEKTERLIFKMAEVL